jgi:aryl-alcohol dehydrogenase-like predicted oxidoreductase
MAGERMSAIGNLEVSDVGVGCNQLGGRVDLEGARALVDAALDAGVTFFDTAEAYGRPAGASEELLGQALEGRRDQVVIATKFGWDDGGGTRDYVRGAAERSLERLRTDVIDLYQYHRPDQETRLAETLGAVAELVTEGKVRYFGISNVSADQVAEAAEIAQRNDYSAFVTVQNEYSLLMRGIERDVLPECERRGLAVLPYFPLAKGLLTGKYRRGEPAPEGTRLQGRGDIAGDETWDRLERLADFCDERDIEPIDVAIGWLAAQPAVAPVIAGATKPEQVRRNAQAGRWRPSEDDRSALDAIFPPATDLD